MNQYAGIDVSLECSSVCVVDANGKILREARVASEPEALIAWFRSCGFDLERIGLEAGPLSQWLFAAMREAGLAVCTENLNPNVLTMKSAQYGARIYDAGSLNLARDRRIFVQ